MCELRAAAVSAQDDAAPPGEAETEPPVYVLSSEGVGTLNASAHWVWLGGRDQSEPETSDFALDPVDSESAAVSDGDSVRLRSEDGRYLTRFGVFDYLTHHVHRAMKLQVVREAGPGPIEMGEAFRLRIGDTQHYLSAQRSCLSLAHGPKAEGTWSLGCHFLEGPYSERWRDEAAFQVVEGPLASDVARAVDWLRARAPEVALPTGSFPLIVWDDPTLAPQPAVAYLMIDTLWAAKALRPYDPDLAAQMEEALLSLGWYGNGLADTLFHGVPNIAHRTESEDAVHGTLLASCVARSADGTPQTVQVRIPEQDVDPAWTEGNAGQFADSAVYTALNDYWNGDVEAAHERLRDVFERRGSDDLMFWDLERLVLVDQASRCDYDSFVGQCSSVCPSCVVCTDGCFYYGASYKLGLVLYAARATGLPVDERVARYLEQIEFRLWEGQLADGGVPHSVLYAAPGMYALSSGATGEATAITVLANTVSAPSVPPER